jgi:hypothetical protein
VLHAEVGERVVVYRHAAADSAVRRIGTGFTTRGASFSLTRAEGQPSASMAPVPRLRQFGPEFRRSFRRILLEKRDSVVSAGSAVARVVTGVRV